MKQPLFTSLAPNTQRDDVIRSLWHFFTLQHAVARDTFDRLTACVQEWYGAPPVFFFESGRSALASLLFCLKLQKQDEVLLQAFTCVAVPNAILWAGGTPMYVDCQEGTPTMSPEDLEKKITPRSRAVIIQHTFGIPAAMDELMRIAKQHNLIVIEDCAHTIGGEYQGKKLGTFGHASIISFGRDKPLSSVFGGAAIVFDEILARTMQSFYLTLKPPSWLWSQRQLLQPFFTSFAKATYSIGFGKVFLALLLLTRAIYPALTKKERIGKKPSFVFHRMPRALGALALHQWQKLERFNAHRKRLSLIYTTALQGMHGIRLIDSKREEHAVFLRYPVFVDDAKRTRDFARKQRIYLGDWYDSPVAPHDVVLSKVGYTNLSCPIAEKFAATTINLPTSIGISENAARRIIVCVKSYLDSLRIPA